MAVKAVATVYDAWLDENGDLFVGFEVSSGGYYNSDGIVLPAGSSDATIVSAVATQARVNASSYYEVTFGEGDTVQVFSFTGTVV